MLHIQMIFCFSAFPEWSEHEEGECDVECGNGTMKVARKCRDSNGTTLKDYYCVGRNEQRIEDCHKRCFSKSSRVGKMF